MTRHVKRSRVDVPTRSVDLACSCGAWERVVHLWSTRSQQSEIAAEFRAHVEAALVAEHIAEQKQHRDWHARTAHCGLCGQPDGLCTCNGCCGCHDLHPAGEADPLARYAVADENQDGLF